MSETKPAQQEQQPQQQPQQQQGLSASSEPSEPAVLEVTVDNNTATGGSSTTEDNPAPVAAAPVPATVAPVPVERQTSVGSIESNMSLGGGGAAGGSSGNSFRSSFSNGRVSLGRFLSSERNRSGADSSRTSGNMQYSTNILNDIFAIVQQARSPNTLFSSERRNQFLQSGRSHLSGSSTPPSVVTSGGAGGATVSGTDVVIDVDAPTTGTSLRSSNNELYPISASSSMSNGMRPMSWSQNGSAEDPMPADGPGRASLIPNFNFHHHHHHFHNHQPLHQHHQQQQQQQQLLLQSQQSTSAGPAPQLGSPTSDLAPGGNGDPPGHPSATTPTSASNPNLNNGTRSNSVSSNPPNDEATVHDALNQIPEARAMMDVLARYTPLLLILVSKLCYDHLDGIIHFLALLVTFYHANWVVRQEISKQKQRRIVILLRELIFIVAGLIIFGLVLERKSIYLMILFMPDQWQPESLKSLLFSVCITDLILKLLTIVIKIIITLLPPSVIEYKSRGKIYLMIESVSQLYRAAAPIQPWLVFLFESYSGSEKMVGVLMSAVYIVAKSTDLLDRFKFCRRSGIKLLQKTSYGTVPTKEQLQACGGQCPICHDNFNSPVLLECNHIFCELCVGTWFDREQTCPLCRAKIVDDPSYRDGATTFFLQLY